MENRNTAIIATVVATLLCGLPGLACVCLGLVSIPASFSSRQFSYGDGIQPRAMLGSGIASLIIGAILVLIPIIVALVMFRNRPPSAAVLNVPPAPSSGPIPPGGYEAPPPPAQTEGPVKVFETKEPEEPLPPDEPIPPAI